MAPPIWIVLPVIPTGGGRVRQTIEISLDAGKTWEMAYDAEYRRKK